VLASEPDGAPPRSLEAVAEFEVATGTAVGEVDSWGLKSGRVETVVTRMAIAVIIPARAVTSPGSVAQKL
jgi:hypothetical protein